MILQSGILSHSALLLGVKLSQNRLQQKQAQQQQLKSKRGVAEQLSSLIN